MLGTAEAETSSASARSRLTIFPMSGRRTPSLAAYSGDVNGRFQREVNDHSSDVNRVGAERRWDYNHARYLRH